MKGIHRCTGGCRSGEILSILVGMALTLPVVTLGFEQTAGDFEIDWWTVDGGGVMSSTGSDFELSGTVGQPDANTAVLSGGDFELTGGFWFGLAPGDCDADGDVDLSDFADFEGCLAGPGGGLGTGCVCFDLDDNGDVDLGDFAEFQLAFTGGS
ncbi:MAG: hypothetical protein JSV19_04795 [Phycisphaerales bacterium]|nr:MAG: hypothetical protein JSV19_04795 [Phycisphaerales bacterium]